MALISFPRFLSRPLESNHRRSLRSRYKCVCCVSPTAAATSKGRSGSAVIWFKQDLRVDDHLGLVAASKYQAVVPLYVFDHRILSRYSNEMLELVIFALEDLRKSLKEQGSDLMIRFGRVENVIRELVEEVKATSVFAEEEVEYHLHQMMAIVDETLAKNLNDLPVSHNEFRKLQRPLTSPILPPTLAGAKLEADWGPLPTFDELKEFVNENPWKLEESWTLINNMSAETILTDKLSKLGKRSKRNLNNQHSPRKRLDKSFFVTDKGNTVGGGTNAVLNALQAYLRYLEGTGRDDWQELQEKLCNAESRDGASFATLFGPALCLGIISRRRVHYEAIKYEKERNTGFLSPFGYSAATVAAAADAVCSMEWYWLMSLRSLRSNEGVYSTRIWRWNGYQIQGIILQYTVAGKEGPAILLVHGFGAFLEHYRDNIYDIADGGNRVWAITLLGFGRSEKPNIVYTELMWSELLRDFTVEVVGEPVHLIGNSIGGYFVAIVACLWPAVVKSVVLINSAGNVIPEYSFLQFSNERQASGPVRLGARLLLFYLRLNISNFVKQCYPTGIKDPISDSKSKVAMFKEHCAGIVIRELDAGHCPHDEKPEEVNSIISEWIVTIESKVPAESFL
ncbi:photolyase/cryptochrome alpha/beta domain-containing protein [Citrus sinensis]|uniref:Photolyase/cryptochrome alpha/beta domain-containing protein n=1 Tax=Citrus sinensis TaxID=2711 RepID=A0ACB8HU24_CITSI|nr:photolyase/cryptochrome alpha/beta domain-containing protein [Citrus sinensis]